MGLFNLIQRKREERAQLNQIRREAYEPEYAKRMIERAKQEGLAAAKRRSTPISERLKESTKTFAKGAVKATKEAKSRRKKLETKTRFATEHGPRGVFTEGTRNIFEGTGRNIWSDNKNVWSDKEEPKK